MSITAIVVSKTALGKRWLLNRCALTFFFSNSAAAASAVSNACCDCVHLEIGSLCSSICAWLARVLDAIGAACCGAGSLALVMGTLGCSS